MLQAKSPGLAGHGLGSALALEVRLILHASTFRDAAQVAAPPLHDYIKERNNGKTRYSLARRLEKKFKITPVFHNQINCQGRQVYGYAQHSFPTLTFVTPTLHTPFQRGSAYVSLLVPIHCTTNYFCHQPALLGGSGWRVPLAAAQCHLVNVTFAHSPILLAPAFRRTSGDGLPRVCVTERGSEKWRV